MVFFRRFRRTRWWKSGQSLLGPAAAVRHGHGGVSAVEGRESPTGEAEGIYQKWTYSRFFECKYPSPEYSRKIFNEHFTRPVFFFDEKRQISNNILRNFAGKSIDDVPSFKYYSTAVFL